MTERRRFVKGEKPKLLTECVPILRSEAETIIPAVVRYPDGSLRIDVRLYVQTGKYSGPTRKGLGFTRAEFVALMDQRDAILATFDRHRQTAEAKETP